MVRGLWTKGYHKDPGGGGRGGGGEGTVLPSHVKAPYPPPPYPSKGPYKRRPLQTEFKVGAPRVQDLGSSLNSKLRSHQK